MKKTILVTGGAGYIGSNTCLELLKTEKYNVIILDNFSCSNYDNIDGLEKISKNKIILYKRDCRNNLDDIFEENKIDAIIHFAAFKSVPESISEPLKYYNNNINSLLNILEYAEKFSVNKIIFSSSAAVYGNIKKLPATEETKIEDVESPYAFTKLAGERILKDLSNAKTEMKIISLRYFNPIGVHESGYLGDKSMNGIVYNLCKSAQTGDQFNIYGTDYKTRDGSCIRDYIHISDVANAHVVSLDFLFTDKSKNYDVYNIGLNSEKQKGVSVFELIDSFEKVNSLKINLKKNSRRVGDVSEVYSDCEKIKEIGWIPKKDLQDMLYSAWKFYTNKINNYE